MNEGDKLIASTINSNGVSQINIPTYLYNQQTEKTSINNNILHHNQSSKIKKKPDDLELNNSINSSSEFLRSNYNSVIMNNIKKSKRNNYKYELRNPFQIDYNISHYYNQLFYSFDDLLSKSNPKKNDNNNLYMIFEDSKPLRHSKSSEWLIDNVKLRKETIYNKGDKINKKKKEKDDIEKEKNKQRERLKEFEIILEEEKNLQLRKKTFFEQQKEEDNKHLESEKLEQLKIIKTTQDKLKKEAEGFYEINEFSNQEKAKEKHLVLEDHHIETESELQIKLEVDNNNEGRINNEKVRVIQLSNEQSFVVEKNNFSIIKKNYKTINNEICGKQNIWIDEEEKSTHAKDFFVQKLIEKCNNKDKEVQKLNFDLAIIKQKLENKVKKICSLEKEIKALEKKLQLKSHSPKQTIFTRQLVVEFSYSNNKNNNLKTEKTFNFQYFINHNQHINKLNYNNNYKYTHKINDFNEQSKMNPEQISDYKSGKEIESNEKEKIKLINKQKNDAIKKNNNLITKETNEEKKFHIPNGKENEESEVDKSKNNKLKVTFTERQSNSIEGYTFKQVNILNYIDKNSNSSVKNIEQRTKQLFEPRIINLEKTYNNKKQINRNRSVGSLFQIENSISKKISFLPIDNIIKKAQYKKEIIKEHSAKSNTFFSYHRVNPFENLNHKKQKANYIKNDNQMNIELLNKRFEQSFNKDTIIAKEFKEHSIMPINDFNYKTNSNNILNYEYI